MVSEYIEILGKDKILIGVLLIKIGGKKIRRIRHEYEVVGL